MSEKLLKDIFAQAELSEYCQLDVPFFINNMTCRITDFWEKIEISCSAIPEKEWGQVEALIPDVLLDRETRDIVKFSDANSKFLEENPSYGTQSHSVSNGDGSSSYIYREPTPEQQILIGEFHKRFQFLIPKSSSGTEDIDAFGEEIDGVFKYTKLVKRDKHYGEYTIVVHPFMSDFIINMLNLYKQPYSF